MPMKRRGFVQGLVLAPAAQAALSAQQAPPNTATPPPTRPDARGVQNVPKLKVTEADITADITQRFFTKDQFEALQKLGSLFAPPLKGNLGALDTHAPEFIDFIIGVSPADRQKLYQNGLDHLNAEAKQKFSKPFAQLDAKQADTIIRPLMTVRFWLEDRPTDPLQDFIAYAHDDLRRATTNSRESVEAAAKSGRRFNRGSQTSGYYWLPIDPVSGE